MGKKNQTLISSSEYSTPLLRQPLFLVYLGLSILVSSVATLALDRYVLARATNHASTKKIIDPLRENSFHDKGYSFINPLLACAVAEDKQPHELVELKNKIKKLVEQKINSHDADAVSVYFGNNGMWLSVNPDETYFPASLMKVPTLIAYFKLAESDPQVLQKKLFYSDESDLNQEQHYKPTKTMIPGHWYTVEELLERLIVYSDNNAVTPLINNFNNDLLLEIYRDIGIELPLKAEGDFMTVKTYANIVRILYNGTYLNWEMSEKALHLLSLSEFPPGIAAGIPSSTPRAQKFGEIDLGNLNLNSQKTKELHDCGIIYFPEHPYSLCIMTKGTDFNALATTIKEVTALTYTFMQNKYPAP